MSLDQESVVQPSSESSASPALNESIAQSTRVTASPASVANGVKKSARKDGQNKRQTPTASAKAKPSPNASNNGQRLNLNKNRYNNGTSHHHSFLEQLDLQDHPVTGVGNDLRANGKKKGPAKTNLNHLLNFTYESYSRGDDYYEYERMNKQFWSMKLNKSSCFSKEQFLQANCQFVVKNTGDYTVNLCDPDRLVDWELIEEVQIETMDSSSLSCPICLYEPVAAKMTKCGHVYCWSCMLHYLSLSDKPWRKCPICYEPIYKKDLKSVSMLAHSAEYKTGDRVDMTLMFKHKSKLNCITLPCDMQTKFGLDETRVSSGSSPAAHSTAYYKLFESGAYSACQKFLKLHSRSAQYIHDAIVEREKAELSKQAEADKDEPEVCFVSEALVLLEEREAQLKAEIESNMSNRNTEVAEEASKESAKSQNHQTSDMVYFYQASDGQRIYINGLNQRCLVAEYGSNLSERAPKQITARIVASESHFMTEENRRSRYKYLSHLPLHSEFRLVELDLDDYLSEGTLEQFKEEINERRQTRERKQIREKQSSEKAQARAAAAAASQQYAYSDYYHTIQTTTAANLSDLNEFPEASSSPPASSSASLASGASSGGGLADTSIANAAAAAAAASQVSFAQMLKQEDTLPGIRSTQNNINDMAWPSLDDSSSNSAPAKTQMTSGWLSMVKQQQMQEPIRRTKYQNAPTPWGNSSSAAVKASADVATSKGKEEDSDEGTDAMPAPHYKQSFFSAIDESLRLIESRKVEEAQPSDNGQNKKKKKKTRQLLFSTS